MDSPLCACMSGHIENAEHYFLKCRRYDECRLELYRELGPNIHWTSNYCTGIVFIGNMLSWLSFHNFV